MRRSSYKSYSSVGRAREIDQTEEEQTPEDVELGNIQTPAAVQTTRPNVLPEDVELGNRKIPAPVQTTPPNVLEHARLGRLDEFRIELESGNHPLDFKAGPDVYFNRTPLHLAAMEGHEEIVKFLLSRPQISREVVNDKDSFGYTPLHLAVRHSRESVVRLLTTSSRVLPDIFLAATSEPDDVGADNGGCTPLHLAAVRGHETIATLLLRQPRQLESAYAPVNIYAMSWNSETPLDLARQNNFRHLVGVLENSDLNYLQQERARNAMSANAILVGAALVAAAAFGAFLQPPGGIPNPDSDAPSPSPSASTSSPRWESAWTAIFFGFAASAFSSSMVALVHGTLASFPIPAPSLKVEVQLLRRAVGSAQYFLVLALVCLMDSLSFATSLVLHKFAGINGTAIYLFITWLPLITHVYVVYYFSSWWSRMREQYGIKVRLILLLLFVSPAINFIGARLIKL